VFDQNDFFQTKSVVVVVVLKRIERLKKVYEKILDYLKTSLLFELMYHKKKLNGRVNL